MSYRLFTLGTGLFFSALLVACAAPSTRVHLKQFQRPEGTPHVLPAPSASNTPPTTTERPDSDLTALNFIRFEPVPGVRLTSPWEVRFGPGCFDTRARPAGETALVAVLGDFVALGFELRVKLDAQLSRVIPAREAERREVALSSLHDVWHSLSAGKHRLSAFAVREDDGVIPFDDADKPAVTFCDFEVDANGHTLSSGDEAGWTLLAPEGTFHGATPPRLLFQAFWGSSHAVTYAPAQTSARLLVVRPDKVREVHTLVGGAQLMAPTPLVPSLPAGDYTLWVDTLWVDPGFPPPHAVSTAGDALASTSASSRVTLHTITVNPE